jgi:hypothetical protein
MPVLSMMTPAPNGIFDLPGTVWVQQQSLMPCVLLLTCSCRCTSTARAVDSIAGKTGTRQHHNSLTPEAWAWKIQTCRNVLRYAFKLVCLHSHLTPHPPVCLHALCLPAVQLEPVSPDDVAAALAVTRPSARLHEARYLKFSEEYGSSSALT